MPGGSKKSMHEVAISEFKARCLSLLEQVNKTKTPLRVTRRGKAVADVIPPLTDSEEGTGLALCPTPSQPQNHKRHNFVGHRNPRSRGSETMRLLLDTHIWLWSLAEPKRLSRRVQHELRDDNNELWLSPVSTWEALLLHVKGRIRLQGNLRGWLADVTATCARLR